MGNFQELLAKSKPIQDYKQIQNVEDLRSDSEIQISNRLVNALTVLNTEKIYQHTQIQAQSKDWSNYIFVCIHGIPSIPKQFDFLNLPGERVHFSGLSFLPEQQNLPENEQREMANASLFQKEAERLNKLFETLDPNKNIILVYHSFGGFFLGFYFYYYGNKMFQKIKGMIDIAGAPFIFYGSAKLFTPIILQTDFQLFQKQIDKVHKIFIKSISASGFSLDFKNKYQTLSFLKYIKSKDYGKGFISTLNHPKILKLIVHGSKDSLFETTLLNEKAIHFCYKRELQSQYEDALIEKYTNIYKPKMPTKNIQERFIFCIPEGQHSVHYKEKNQKLIKLAAHQYLNLIHE